MPEPHEVQEIECEIVPAGALESIKEIAKQRRIHPGLAGSLELTFTETSTDRARREALGRRYKNDWAGRLGQPIAMYFDVSHDGPMMTPTLVAYGRRSVYEEQHYELAMDQWLSKLTIEVLGIVPDIQDIGRVPPGLQIIIDEVEP